MTPNKEDYLKCIYEIGERQEKITNKLIAEMMAVSAPAVSEMIKKMIAETLIIKDKTAGYLLTEKGSALVTELYRKHRLLEAFLIHHLHYTVEEIHEEAEILEHTVSTMFIDRLEENLGFPEFCPHGGTIPRKNQPLIEKHRETLSQITEIGDYQLVRIIDTFDLLNYLELHQLTIGTPFSLTAIDQFAQTYQITYNGRELTIPVSIAKLLFVSRCS